MKFCLLYLTINFCWFFQKKRETLNNFNIIYYTIANFNRKAKLWITY